MLRLFSLVIFIFLFEFASAQTWSAGVLGGISNYQGDLVDGAYVGRFTRPAVGFTLGRSFTSRLSARLGLTFASVAGDDQYNGKEYLRSRNLRFASPITEGSLLAQFHAFDLETIRWTPYVFGGIAVFRFNPYATDISGNRVNLQPLGTEGQGLPGYTSSLYGRTQLALPFGGGFKFALTDNIHVGLEVGVRKLFTDYLDDVSTNYPDANDLLNGRGPLAVQMSYRGGEVPGGDPAFPAKGAQRGGATEKDWYYISALHLNFLLNNNGNEGNYRSGGRGRKGYGCPTNF